jgi:hypothetical protein
VGVVDLVALPGGELFSTTVPLPPVFGHNTFEQVVANIGKSLKESCEHLQIDP